MFGLTSMSVLPSQTNWTLNDSKIPTMLAGTIALAADAVAPYGVSTVVGGLTSTSIVNVTYVHPSAGGASQWVTNVAPSTNWLTVSFGGSISSGDYLNYIAKVQ